MPVLIGPRVLRPASHVSAHGSRRLRLRTGYYWVNRRLDYFKLPLGGFQSGSGRLAADLGRIRSGEVDAATSTSSPLSPRLSGLCYRQKIYSAINYLTTYDFLRKATLDMSCFRLNEKAKGAGQKPGFRRVFHKIPCFGSADDSSNQVAADECVPAKITGGPGGVVVLESVPSINQSADVDQIQPHISAGPRASKPVKLSEPSRAETERAEFGLKVLYDCDDAEVDIITIHGLNGHRERTFTADGVCWPSSLLPSVIPRIRVLSYGYDARTYSSSPLSRAHLHDHAEQLVERLTRKRTMTKTTNRPIIFIAHSLGGIVVKSALILSASYNTTHLEAQKSISLSTHGVLFMGTPHAGGEGVSWGRLALNLASMIKNTKSEYLDVLETHSQWLEQQQVQYMAISSRFDTMFFYEVYETVLPGGKSVLIVPRYSACIPGVVDAEVVAIASDHAGLVKFRNAEDEGFVAVAESVQCMLREATKKVAGNWREWEAVRAIGEAQKLTFSIPMNLPFSRNRNFTGRHDELLAMHAVLQESEADARHPRIAVLYGLGGMGKTQLAIQYAHCYGDNYTSVWWVNANTTAALTKDFLKILREVVSHHARLRTGIGQNPDYAWIATMLGLPFGAINEAGKITAVADTEVVVAAVKGWLGNEDNGRWLLIIDNYDDLENVDIADYLPREGGRIIITSRAQDSQRLGKGLEVEGAQMEDCLEILRKSAGTKLEHFDKERGDAIEIVQKLGALPLALDQAGAYINSLRISYSQYLPRFTGEFARIAGKRPPKSVWQYREDTVFTTWEVSFNALGRGAQALLLLCGFLDNEDIWEGMLSRKILMAELGIECVEDAIQEIFALSLAKRKRVGDSFWIHSMVHKWSLERLDEAKRGGKAMVAVSLTSAALSVESEGEFLDLARRLMPHVKICTDHICHEGYLEFVTDMESFGEIEMLSTAFSAMGEVGDNERLCRWILTRKTAVLGENHNSTLTSAYVLAIVLGQQARYDDALQLYRLVLAENEKVLGPEHLSTLDVVEGIGFVNMKKGMYDDALELYGRVLAGREKALGKDHPDSLRVTNSVASVLARQLKYDDALELYERVLAGQEIAYGEDNSEILTTVSNMASVAHNQGRYDDSMKMFERVLAWEEKALGKDHISTLTTVNNMAALFEAQENYEDALRWYARVLAGEEKALGKDHPTTLMTVANIALVYGGQEKYTDSLELFARALDGLERSLGNEHPTVLTMLCNMASVLSNQEKYVEALELFERVLVGEEKAFGKGHAVTLGTVSNMAWVFMSQGKYDDALQLYERVLAGEEVSFGKDHPDTLATVCGMASILDKQGKYTEAREFYRRALNGQENSLGKDHPTTLATLYTLAMLCSKQGMHGDALELFRRLLAEEETTLGMEDLSTLTTVHGMAKVFNNQGEYQESLRLYDRVVAGREIALGRDHPDTLASVYGMAEVFQNQGKYGDAFKLYERVLAGEEIALGKDHPSTLTTVHGMASLFDKQGRYTEAIKLYERALAGREIALGIGHPETRNTRETLAALLLKQGLEF